MAETKTELAPISDAEIAKKMKAMKKLPRTQGQTEPAFYIGRIEDVTSDEGQEQEDVLCSAVRNLRGSVRYEQRGKTVDVWSAPNPQNSRRQLTLNAESKVA